VPTELLSAAEIARDFLVKAGHAFARLEKAEFDEAKGQWNLQFDVGLAVVKLKNIVVDDTTGKVVAVE
jgi:hypothetical protein